MESLLLKNILCQEISIDDVCKWLSNEQTDVKELSKIQSFACSQVEFVIYFLNHIRETTSSLQANQIQCSTPNIKTSKHINLKSLNDSINNLKSSKENIECTDKILEKNTISNQTTLNENLFTKSFTENQSKTPFENISNDNSMSNCLSPQCSTPLSKSSIKIEKSDSKLSDCNSSNFSTISPVRRLSDINKSGSFTKSLRYEHQVRDNIYSKNKNKSFESTNSFYDNSISIDHKISRYSDNSRTSAGLCLGDFIPSSQKILKIDNTDIDESDNMKHKEHRKRVRTRRINPTHLNSSINKQDMTSSRPIFNQNFRSSESHPAFKSSSMKNLSEIMIDDRNMLREECLKMQTREFNSDVKICILKKCDNEPDATDYLKPNFKLVTHKEILDVFCDLYATMLDRNLVLNIFNELHFILNLLLIRERKPGDEIVECKEITSKEIKCIDQTDNLNIDIEKKSYFDNIHNCIYFATKMLLSQFDILSMLDRATLKYLREHHDIQFMCPHLYNRLGELCNKKSKIERKSIKLRPLSHANVCFIEDTDNRANFPTVTSFHSFKKQRDLFYEILRIWEMQHLNARWNFSNMLGLKIHSLMSVHTDPFNYMHLARLFKAQLLSSCVNGVCSEDDATAPFLKNVSSKKLSLLQSRLTTSHTHSSTMNDFPGYEEFYRDFICYANNYNFLKHLADCLVNSLHELQTMGLNVCELNCDDNNAEIQMEYINFVKTTKLLAKFLALIDSLPYKTDVSVKNAEKLINVQINVRSEVNPLLDFRKILNCSMSHCALITTIPWVTEYLSFLDSVTIRLPIYKDILVILFQIYKCLVIEHNPTNPVCSPKRRIFKNNNTLHLIFNFSVFNNIIGISNDIIKNIFELPAKSKFVLKFCLGRLFDRSHFPEELYFTWWVDCIKSRSFRQLEDQTGPKNISVDRFQTNDELLNEHLVSIQNFNESVVSDMKQMAYEINNQQTNIDNLDLIDENVLYEICPYLTELKLLLLNNTIKSSLTSRHITPVSTIANKITDARQLELQLENTFFNSHPSSMRKTVDFVSERVASCCVKYVCNTLVPYLKNKSILRIKEAEESIISKNSHFENIQSVQSELNSKAHAVANECYSELKSACCTISMCEERCESSLTALLAPDLQKPVIQLCVDLAARNAREKVLHWIQTRASEDTFTKDFDIEISKFIKRWSNGEPNMKSSNTAFKPVSEVDFVESMSPVEIIDRIRSVIWTLLEYKSDYLTWEYLKKMLNDVLVCLSHNCDHFKCAYKILHVLSVELALALVTYKPSLIHNKSVLSDFTRVWKLYNTEKKDEPKKLLKYQPVTNDTFEATFSEDMSINEVDRSDLPLPEVRPPSDSPFCRIICPRNIFMLSQSREKYQSWNALGYLLSRMLVEQIIDTDDLGEQCTSVLRVEWPSDILKGISKTFNIIAEEYRSSGCPSDKFTLLLEFLSETCEELENF